MIIWKKIFCDRCMQKVFLYDGYKEDIEYKSANSNVCYYHYGCWYMLLKEQYDKKNDNVNTLHQSQ